MGRRDEVSAGADGHGDQANAYSGSSAAQTLHAQTLPVQALSVREAYQILKDVAVGFRVMAKCGLQSWDEVYACHFEVEVDGWRFSIYNDCDTLDHCQWCASPDGRRWDYESAQRSGIDPVALMSAWEHATFERLLKSL